MNSGVLNFALGLNNAGFIDGIKRSDAAVDGFQNKTRLASGMIENVGKESLGTREKVEVLRNSFDNLGGSFAMLGGYARMLFDPLTIGFAAVFVGMELLNSSLKESGEQMRNFLNQANSVENIVRGINAARPTDENLWEKQSEEMAKLGEKYTQVKNIADGFNDVLKGADSNSADAANEQLAIEQQKIELLKQQGLISEQDAAKRIEALKDQAVLQKNLNETTGIKNEIRRRQGELEHVNALASQAPSQSQSFGQQLGANAHVDDLKKQLEDLPKAIAGEDKLINEANSRARGTKNVPKKAQWWQQSDLASQRKAQLESSLAAAKSALPAAIKAASDANENVQNSKTYKDRASELRDIITGLQNQLGVATDKQNKLTPLELQKNRLEALMKMSAMLGDSSRPQSTSWEKMGAIMRGSGGLMRDYASQMAVNTQKMISQLDTSIGLLSQIAGGAGMTNQI